MTLLCDQLCTPFLQECPILFDRNIYQCLHGIVNPLLGSHCQSTAIQNVVSARFKITDKSKWDLSTTASTKRKASGDGGGSKAKLSKKAWLLIY